MNTCMAFKTNGARCTHGPVPTVADEIPIPAHVRLCRTHQRIYRDRYTASENTHHTEGCCFDKAGVRGVWCTHPAVDGTGRCVAHNARHAHLTVRRAAVALRQARRQDAFDYFDQRVPAPTWRQVVRELYAPDAPPVIRNADVDITFLMQLYYQRNRDVAVDPMWWRGGREFVFAYRQWFLQGEQGPEPQAVQFLLPLHVALPAPPAPAPAVQGLGALSQDTQNVHRAVVAVQTNRNIDLLLATPDVPEGCRAHELLAATWLNHNIASWKNVVLTITDIIQWRDKPTCKTTNDWLYRRVLHGLYMRIHRLENADLRKELWRRFYEECSESIGLCCEGHLSRLANVLVGFEDDFKPPVPFGEILQAKMAAISEMEVSVDEKVKIATAFFDEHKVPAEDRTAWLDAF